MLRKILGRRRHPTVHAYRVGIITMCCAYGDDYRMLCFSQCFKTQIGYASLSL